ncbi:MAG: preprotein translocase subunit SecY [Candidatus Dojkabacteria bacterium]|nr:preprotein translocase subunit SecY [Candidatus Dojkabacteria bacterium]
MSDYDVFLDHNHRRKSRQKYLGLFSFSTIKYRLFRISRILLVTRRSFFYFGFLKEFFTNKVFQRKILITLFIVIVYRFLASIPLPGINMQVYQDIVSNRNVTEINYLFSLFTGGQLDSPSIVGLGLVAYINVSIIMQILPYVINKLREIQKDGERGRQIINQITRLVTFPVAILYGFFYLLFISQQNFGYGKLIDVPLGSDTPSFSKLFFMSLILATGTLLLMWLSEIITEKGFGNGSSIIITIGILSSVPQLIVQDLAKLDFNDIINQVLAGSLGFLSSSVFITIFGTFIGLIILIVLVTFISEAVRKISIQYSRRPIGIQGAGMQVSYFPIKLTLTGVLPVLFAFAVMYSPQVLVPLFQRIVDISSPLYKFLENLKSSVFFASIDNQIDFLDTWYVIINFVLVVFFSLFYSVLILNPADTSDNLRRNGVYIPGVRPGKATQEYLTGVILRVSLIGGIFLGIISIVPIIARNYVVSTTGVTVAILSGIGGTSLLIVVGVVTELVRQYKSIKATKGYEKFL